MEVKYDKWWPYEDRGEKAEIASQGKKPSKNHSTNALFLDFKPQKLREYVCVSLATQTVDICI